MKKDREQLSDLITLILIKNNANNKLREKLEEDLENKFRLGVFSDYYNQRTSLKFASIEELYVITDGLYKNFNLVEDFFRDKSTNEIDLKKLTFKKEEINPDEWFSINEKTSANEIDIKHKKKDKDIYFELNNVDEVETGIWISSHESIKNLVDNWDRGAIIYNPETQRKGEIKFVLGETLRVPKLYDENVNEIEQALENNEFYMNMITLNILDMGGEERKYIEYFPQERKLRIRKTENSIVNIIDGMHRLNAAKRALSKKPDLVQYFAVRVLNLNVKKAQNVIFQEQKSTPLDEETKRRYDIKNPFVLISERINNFGSENENSMYHKLTDSIEEIDYNKKFCLFSNITNGLEDNFVNEIKNTSPFKREQLVSYLVEFYNVFIGMFENYFNDLEYTKNNMVIADVNIFTGILKLAKKLYNDEDWKNKLIKILNNIIWDKTNPIWKDIPTNSLIWNKSVSKKLYGVFNDIINERVGA